MKKPFNPIIGETLEGFWPDGTKIYAEHISHHPPISNYMVEHPEGKFKMHGSYEYVAKMADLGNSVSGGSRGYNKCEFNDGTTIHYDYPTMAINGLIMGKRTVKFQGKVEFTESKTGMKAWIEFNKEGSVFKRSTGPIDEFKGEILDSNGTVLSNLEGSWLDRMVIDGV